MIPAGFLAPNWSDAPFADPDIDGPGTRCPWPFDPQVITANGPVPLGMYHCPYCGSMVIAGVPHPDFREEF